jgi:hypothetical protein
MQIKQLIGETLTAIEGKRNDVDLTLHTASGKIFRFFHEQDCCESVWIEDICGEMPDLLGAPIINADVETSGDDPPGTAIKHSDDSFTWTFYRFTTAKGQVVVRWCGESNGYYSESVSITVQTPGQPIEWIER